MQRTLLPLGIAIAVIVAVAWLWAHRPQSAQTAPPPITPATTPATPVPTSTPDVLGRYRLAGTAVGDEDSWAAIELPDGASNLYRIGAMVPGLGRIESIDHDHVILTGKSGELTLPLKPAPSVTPDQRKVGSAPKRAAVTPTPEPEPEAEDSDTTDESDSEDAPDPPAS